MVSRDPNPPSQSAVELVLLSVLGDGPQYGYAISKRVAAGSEGAIRLTPGVLYPLLRTLEKQGLIAATWETVKSERAEEGTQGRKRKWYRLSAKGRKHLDQRIAAHRAHQAMIERFLSGGGETAEEA
jgi:DNA-binding PadR family transcriptional regulator